MAQIKAINWVLVLMGQFCFFMVTQAYYDVLNVKIKNGDELIELNWKRTKQHLVNDNLPIWFAARDTEPALAPNIMQEIGEVLTYQDLEKLSAVVYVSKKKVFYGIIDTRFYILQLPFDEMLGPNVYYEVGNGYIFARNENENPGYFHKCYENFLSKLLTEDEKTYINSIIDSQRIPLDPQQSSLTTIQQNVDDSMYTTSAQIPQVEPTEKLRNTQQSSTELHRTSPDIFYSEILVFVNNNVIVEFRKLDINEYNNLLILHYIVYFNAIDMLFTKLATDTAVMYINIAGIVIESEPGIFSNSIPMESNQPNIPQRLYADRTMFGIMKYIRKYKNTFPIDSFDFFFLSTNYAIQKSGEILPAYSRSMIDVYVQRRHNLPYDDLLGSIVQYKEYYSDFIVATRGLAKLLSIDYDLPSEELKIGNAHGQCDTIMQKSNSFCHNCLGWSSNSQRLFKSYFRSNRNRCFLINYPRSLRPYGYAAISMSSRNQCLCYGFAESDVDLFHPIGRRAIDVNGCNTKLRCADLNRSSFTPLPLDGTPCDLNQNNKVCWKTECIKIGNSFNSDDTEPDSPEHAAYHDSRKRLRTSNRVKDIGKNCMRRKLI